MAAGGWGWAIVARGHARPTGCRCWPSLGASSSGIPEARAICSAVQQSRCPSKRNIPESRAAYMAHMCGTPSSSCKTAWELTTMTSVTELRSPQGGCGTPFVCLCVCGGWGELLSAAAVLGPGSLTISPLSTLTEAVGQDTWHAEPCQLWGHCSECGGPPRRPRSSAESKIDCFSTTNTLKAVISTVSSGFVLKADAGLSAVSFLCLCPSVAHPCRRNKTMTFIYLTDT